MVPLKFLRTLLGLPSVWIALTLLLLHGVLIFGRKDVEIAYGDSGLMYLQARQLVDAGYATFAFDYPGVDLDPGYEFVPYRKPFLAPVEDKYFIDFPPYFPFLAAPLLASFGYPGLYLPGFVALGLTFGLLIACARLVGLGRIGRSTVLLAYGLFSTVPLYNYIFHEYPLALALWAGALYCLLHVEKRGFSPVPAILFGLCSGLAVVFRMELVLVAAAGGLAYLLVIRDRWLAFGLYAALGALLPLGFLFVANEVIHGHPLGLRYTMTISENANPDSRWTIIYGLLFSEVRGMLWQSPFFLLILLFPFAKLERPGRLLLTLVGSAFVAILVTSPNHGDHIAARYLFGIFAPGCILCALVIRDFRFQTYRRALAIFAMILFVVSFRAHYKAYLFIQGSDRVARTVLERLDQIEARHVVFGDYGPPLNLQNRFDAKTFLVAETPAKKVELSKRLHAAGVPRWAVAGNVTFPGETPDPQAFYRQLINEGWPLDEWRPDRILLEPPLFVVEVTAPGR